LLAGGTSILLLLTLAGSPAIGVTPCGSPPATFPTSQMTRGMTGVGYTVIQGDTIEPFDVRVLGVLPNAYYVGIDVVVMEMTGPSSFVATTGGAVAGMSGSPVYIQDRLAGALAWAVAEDRRIFGVTAAEDMMTLFRIAGGTTGDVPSELPLTREVRRAIAASTGQALASTPATIDALPIPLGVSAAGGRTLAKVEHRFANHGIQVSAFHAAAAEAPTATTVDPAPLVPGGGFGMALSYGDVSYYGFGTTTAVCGSYAIGWGHPFNGSGTVAMGLNDVDVFGIDNGTFWGTKIGVLTEAHGTMTQDRFAGVAGVFGVLPRFVSVDSTFTSRDTGLSRDGHTDVAWDEPWFISDVAGSHAWANVGYLLQADAPGTLGLGWTIQGTREDGTPFTVSNRMMAYSSWTAAEGVWRMTEALNALVWNEFEPVELTGVDMTGTVTEEDRTAAISRVRVASDLQPKLRARDVLKVRPGDTVRIEVTLDPIDGDDAVANLTMRIPRNAKGVSSVELRGGRDRGVDYGAGSLDELLAQLNGGEHANDLIVRGPGGRSMQEQDVIVTGSALFWVRVVR
jgi:hypothetical protein